MMAPHRILFPAGGIWAIVAVGPVALDTGFDPTRSPLGGLTKWHAHEMLFGFAAAMFAGYALTAMTSWPGKARLSPEGVATLVALWALARLSAAGALGPEPGLAAPAAVAFMGFLTLILARSALRSRALRAAPLALFSLAMTGYQIAVVIGAGPIHLPVLAFAALLSVVGGRMVAAFTANSLTCSERQTRRVQAAGIFGLFGSVTILTALGLETLRAAPGWLGACLLLAAAFETTRALLLLSREILTDGLLLMLHAGYFWLPIGLALVALGKTQGAPLPEGAALHGIATGAVACTIYAVAARAVAWRRDRLRASPFDGGGFVLVWVAAAWRVFAPAESQWAAAASALWGLAWAIFLARHGAALFHPAPRPVFSGPRRPDLGHPQDGQDRVATTRSEAS